MYLIFSTIGILSTRDAVHSAHTICARRQLARLIDEYIETYIGALIKHAIMSMHGVATLLPAAKCVF